MTQYGFYYNVDNCIGCMTCQVACKDTWDLPIGILNRTVHSFEAGSFPNPKAYFVSMSCNHCESPACVANCPQGAMTKSDEDGRVTVDQELCIQCGTCVKSCPYGAPKLYTEQNRIVKCDLCADLVAQGEEPACVASCMMRAIEWGDIEELRTAYGENADIEGIPDSGETGPSIVIAPHRCLS